MTYIVIIMTGVVAGYIVHTIYQHIQDIFEEVAHNHDEIFMIKRRLTRHKVEEIED